MPVRINNSLPGNLVEVTVSGKLTADDYHAFTPDMQRIIDSHGKIRVLFVMDDFHGWEPGAMWEDAKFDFRHAGNIERLAMVGETKWQSWLCQTCGALGAAECRYFEREQMDEARDWVAR